MNRVSVIILNYKSWQDTFNEIEMCRDVAGVDYKDIIVVDNCSPNESAQKLDEEARKKGFIFIQSKRNDGYAAGNNIGLRYAFKQGYDYSWILNNDVVIDDKLILRKMLHVFELDKSIAVVSPDICAPRGHVFNRDSIRPNLFDYTVGIYFYKKKGRHIEDKGGYGLVYRPQGCCMLLDLKKLAQIDYLDEKTFLYCEEIILAERLLKNNYFCACCNIASVIHNHSKTVRSVHSKSSICKMNNDSLRYYLKTYRNFNWFEIQIICLFNYIKLMII